MLANSENERIRPKVMTIKGRNVTFAKTCGAVLDSSFDELCGRPLGAIDYLTIAQYFHTVIIRDIPKLSLQYRTEARRFITLIDTFYDHNIRLLISAQAPDDQLFMGEKIENAEQDDDNRKLMDDLGIQLGDVSGSMMLTK